MPGAGNLPLNRKVKLVKGRLKATNDRLSEIPVVVSKFVNEGKDPTRVLKLRDSLMDSEDRLANELSGLTSREIKV